MTKIVFFDTETTSLLPNRRAWDLGLIVRDDTGKPDREISIIITDADFTDADPQSLEIGRAYQRHPRFNLGMTEPNTKYLRECDAAAILEHETRNAHIVGSVPDFDTLVSTDLLRRNGYPWSGHYHLIDVENLIIGYLAGQAAQKHAEGALSEGGRDVVQAALLPPWDTARLAQLIGVPLTPPNELHTGIGDARFARRIWDTITGHRPVA